jgi:hypothetical protein
VLVHNERCEQNLIFTAFGINFKEWPELYTEFQQGNRSFKGISTYIS